MEGRTREMNCTRLHDYEQNGDDFELIRLGQKPIRGKEGSVSDQEDMGTSEKISVCTICSKQHVCTKVHWTNKKKNNCISIPFAATFKLLKQCVLSQKHLILPHLVF